MPKKVISIILILLGAWLGQDWLTESGRALDSQPSVVQSTPASSFASGAQVSGEGVVQRILADDNDGSRHQRFILELTPGRTVLIAHNIDLAPRIDSLRTGDKVAFYGQFEENDRGGVIHWTHHDPQGFHEHGWLKHEGRTYQ
ncbi:MAG: DUF3465 domain-containing protein [Woeseia sp.]|nr:DUF3465 domain-containing protein [Woeseia sp.]MBT8095723.1 DUF3465 domain-containing protein [Woeseia sp.]NNE61356.1 DUF3465 domain-containing protein [Woeseia sp.]NNL55907.1 DUF3465 domain-containing protein [Woeseia sp.]